VTTDARATASTAAREFLRVRSANPAVLMLERALDVRGTVATDGDLSATEQSRVLAPVLGDVVVKAEFNPERTPEIDVGVAGVGATVDAVHPDHLPRPC